MKRRVVYELLGKGAYVVEELEIFQGLWIDIASRVAWYRQVFHVDVEVMSVRYALFPVKTRVQDQQGNALCWFCLAPATVQCAACGDDCCDEHGWMIEDKYTPLGGHIECVECEGK